MMGKVGVICPICLKTHIKVGVQRKDEDGIISYFIGDPYCSDECRDFTHSLNKTMREEK